MTEQPIHWETEGTSRVPFALYTDEERHKKELARFFLQKPLELCRLGGRNSPARRFQAQRGG